MFLNQVLVKSYVQACLMFVWLLDTQYGTSLQMFRTFYFSWLSSPILEERVSTVFHKSDAYGRTCIIHLSWYGWPVFCTTMC